MIFGIILGLMVIVLGVMLLLRPIIVKPILRKLMRSDEYDPLPSAKEYPNYTLYSTAAGGELKSRDLVVVFMGGAFLIQSPRSYYGLTNRLYTALSKTHDVLLLCYPVRFSYTIKQSMLAINETLSNVAVPYKACHFIGFSAGALLAGTFARKERNQQISRSIEVPQIGLRVDSLVSVCGLLYSSLRNDLLDALLGYYVFWKTPSQKSYHAQAMNVPVLVVSSVKDLLYNQTLSYVQSEPCESKIFNATLSHVFAQNISTPESTETVKLIVAFIRKATSAK